MGTQAQVQAGEPPERDEAVDDLAARVEARIEGRMPNRIRDLHVTCSGDLLVLRGRVRTYHAKQLAQEAALDLIGGAIPLLNQIVVG